MWFFSLTFHSIIKQVSNIQIQTSNFWDDFSSYVVNSLGKVYHTFHFCIWFPSRENLLALFRCSQLTNVGGGCFSWLQQNRKSSTFVGPSAMHQVRLPLLHNYLLYNWVLVHYLHSHGPQRTHHNKVWTGNSTGSLNKY